MVYVSVMNAIHFVFTAAASPAFTVRKSAFVFSGVFSLFNPSFPVVQPAVMVSRLSKEFRTGCACWPRGGATGGTAVVAVCDNSFAVEAGEVFGLLGPNGAGKTTTLNMIIAETAPTRGHVRWTTRSRAQITSSSS